jgi:hypothetical protein
MNTEKPQFIFQNELTDTGRKVVAFLEAGVTEALGRVQGQDVSSLNHLSGPFQDYYVHVMAMQTITPAQFVKERTYAVESVWQLITQQEQAAADKEHQEQTTASLTDRLAKLEKALTEALAKIAEDDKAEPAAEEADEEPPAAPKSKAKKSPVEPEEPAAEKGAEGDTETEVQK